MEIEDETGKKVKANAVFAIAIRFLKDDLLSILNDCISGVFKPDEIVWVLTVPAIWDDGVKQFIREAAEEAGISSDKLTIALESESASIYCRNLPLERSSGEHALSAFKSRSKFLVVDAGEITTNGAMKNIFKASGGDWGGTKVDEAYFNILADVVGSFQSNQNKVQTNHDNVFFILLSMFNIQKLTIIVLNVSGNETLLEYKRTHMEDYLILMWNFEVKKRAINPLKSNIAVTFGISNLCRRQDLTKFSKGFTTFKPGGTVDIAVQEVAENGSMKNIYKASGGDWGGTKVSIKDDKMKVDMTKQIDAIAEHVVNLTDQSTIGDIAAIVLVPILVVGIDFGTTYSGWAYLLRSAFVDNPTKDIKRDMEIKDETGKKLKANIVFSVAISFCIKTL
ncbi:HS12A-like protein [Mya arenaria]|uniref:HS12A-like protein n=1 Tax=Mya arenaria TaxID=6604 RepID=A0ABY7FWG9_MYAAR|nr:HS12A-like protein [Mya arenaria]